MPFESSPDSVPALLQWQALQNPRAPACACRTPDGRWIVTTWGELWDEVRGVSDGLRRLGLCQGDRLAVLARTRREWLVAEMAALLAGAVVVGIEPYASPEHMRNILQHCGASFLLADDAEMVASVPEEGLATVARVIVFDGPEPSLDSSRGICWKAVREQGAEVSETAPAHARTDDPATIIYTSGTTGRPKAVCYSHNQLLLACRSIVEEFPEISPGDAFLCWLPMAHLFQRMMNLVAVARGNCSHFVEDPREIMTAIGEVRPAVFIGVPRFYERLYDGIQQRLAQLPRWLAPLVAEAIATGRECSARRRKGHRLSRSLRIRHAVLDRFVLARIRRTMGGALKFMVTGSAPTPAWLLEFFDAIGLLLLEAYGVSENVVPMAANRVGDYRIGSVGKPFAANEIRLAADGEILVRGAGVFESYHGGPEEVAGRLDGEGFYRTGDIGRFDADGFLYLTGRKAEIIKTSTGRRISPVAIEVAYAQSPYIDQIVVIGNGRKYLVGLIAICRGSMARHLKESGLNVPAWSHEWAAMPEVVGLIQQELARLGRELPVHERVVDFALLPEPLSVARQELTTTLKVRREQVATRYADLIEGLYRGAAVAGGAVS